MSRNEIGLREARQQLGDLVTGAQFGTTTVITRNGRPVAMLTPYTQEPTMTVTLFETNDDSLVLVLNEAAWNLGPITPDMGGQFAADAAAWVDGDWEPTQVNGQTPTTTTTTTDDLTAVAEYAPGDGVKLLVNPDALGGAASAYLGDAVS